MATEPCPCHKPDGDDLGMGKHEQLAGVTRSTSRVHAERGSTTR